MPVPRPPRPPPAVAFTNKTLWRHVGDALTHLTLRCGSNAGAHLAIAASNLESLWAEDVPHMRYDFPFVPAFQRRVADTVLRNSRSLRTLRLLGGGGHVWSLAVLDAVDRCTALTTFEVRPWPPGQRHVLPLSVRGAFEEYWRNTILTSVTNLNLHTIVGAVSPYEPFQRGNLQVLGWEGHIYPEWGMYIALRRLEAILWTTMGMS